MRIHDLVDLCHTMARNKGWYDKPRSDLTYAALFHGEVAEFTEEVRDGKPAVYPSKDPSKRIDGMDKPEGQAIELIDLVIRLADYFGYKGWNLEIAGGATTEQLLWRSKEDLLEVAGDMNMNEPMDFAEILHIQIAAFAELLMEGKELMAGDELGTVLALVIWYFQLQNWDFESLFRLKYEYNSRRPTRHGGKAY